MTEHEAEILLLDECKKAAFRAMMTGEITAHMMKQITAKIVAVKDELEKIHGRPN